MGDRELIIKLAQKQNLGFELSLNLDGELTRDDIKIKNAHLKGVLDLNTDKIIVTGTISYEICAQCDRCLEAIQNKVEAEFCEAYYLAGTENTEAEYFFEGDTLDLAPLVRDCALNCFPQVLLCEQECKGICFMCGQNKNIKECGCTALKNEKGSPFNILSKEIQNGSSKEKNI